MGRGCFYAVEGGMLGAPVLVAVLIVYLTGPVHWVMFVCGNLAAVAAGYLYTSKTFSILFAKQIIR